MQTFWVKGENSESIFFYKSSRSVSFSLYGNILKVKCSDNIGSIQYIVYNRKNQGCRSNQKKKKTLMII